MAHSKKENPPRDLESRYRSELAQKDHKPIFISKLPRPVRPLGPGYSLPEPPPPIPKLTDPKKTPKKKVRRELAPGYQTFEIFRDIVKRNTEKEPETVLDFRNAPDFQKLEIIEGLKDIFSRLQTECQDLNEIRWFLTSHWKDELSERHIFRIARGIWKFIVLHCEDVESKDGQAEEVKQEIQGSQADLPATTAEEQESKTTATNGAKEFDPRDLEKGPRGKLIGIALSGRRSGIGVRTIVACIGKTKAPCPSTIYNTFKDWYREGPQLFYNFLFRLRKAGEEWERARVQKIPDKYYEKYQ